MTTLSIAVYAKKNPNKRLSVPEAVAYVKETCRSIKTKISSKTEGKVSHLFFIFLIVFLINLTFIIFVKDRFFPRYLAISSILAYIFYLDYFLKVGAKKGDKVTEQTEIVNEALINFKPYSNKISLLSHKFGKRFADPEFFVKNASIIAKKFKSVIPKTNNLKSLAMVFITTAEEYVKENSDMTMTEISSTARQITKYVMSLFDISQRVTLLLPISWLAIVYIVVKWKEQHPEEKITKQIILKAAKEYFYKANIKLSKYKAKTTEQKIVAAFAAPYLFLTLLVFFPPVKEYLGQEVKQYGFDVNRIRLIYSVVAAVYMVESIIVASQTLEKEY